MLLKSSMYSFILPTSTEHLLCREQDYLSQGGEHTFGSMTFAVVAALGAYGRGPDLAQDQGRLKRKV